MIAKRKNEFADLEAFWEVLEVLTDDTQTKRVLGSGTISGFEASIINLPYQVKISYDGDSRGLGSGMVGIRSVDRFSTMAPWFALWC